MKDRHASALVRLIPPLSFFTLSLASNWGADAMLAIHPDAAACGFSGLGLVLATSGRLTLLRIAVSVALCMLSIACKQNSAFAFVILLAFIWWRGRGKWIGKALLV